MGYYGITYQIPVTLKIDESSKMIMVSISIPISYETFYEHFAFIGAVMKVKQCEQYCGRTLKRKHVENMLKRIVCSLPTMHQTPHACQFV